MNLVRFHQRLLLIAASVSSVSATDGGRSKEAVDYSSSVKPLLARKCAPCHGALRQKAGLRLDVAKMIRKGSRRGPVVVAGDSSASALIERVTTTDVDERMPPHDAGERLELEEVRILREWIDQGARAPDEALPLAPGSHWAFVAPARRPGGMGDSGSGEDGDEHAKASTTSTTNRIDAHLSVIQNSQGVVPVGPASKDSILRRVYIDLVGLPPTIDELYAFREDDSADAYEKVVDRLLASPRYAERWARHWMDVWRYSDWAGYGNEIRYSQRNIWRWRDWILDALDTDMGYDRMILEMLAADEFAPGDDHAIRATGFLARNWYKFDRNSWLDDTVEHTLKAFVGLTVNCARCHDHKYDPISQSEYYRLRAIFEPYDVRTDRVRGEPDTSKTGVARIYDARPDAKTLFFAGGDPNRADADRTMTPGALAVLGLPALDPVPIALPIDSYYPALRRSVVDEQVDALRQRLKKAAASLATAAAAERLLAEKKLEAARAQLASFRSRVEAERARFAPSGSQAELFERLAREASTAERRAALAAAEERLATTERELRLARAAVAKAGTPSSKRIAAATKSLAAAKKAVAGARQRSGESSSKYTPLGSTFPRSSTGRRLALARWIVHPRNPLTARVAAHHVWMRHFGQALVRNVDDFGLRSLRPLQADLLDELAVSLMEGGWSMKRLHRAIVTSAAYRRRSTTLGAPRENLLADRDNQTYWRGSFRRAEAEVVRDSILHSAGRLDLARGGPELDSGKGQAVARRSIYFRHARQRRMPFLTIFDSANPRECYRRRESVTPQQAYALVNSPIVARQSAVIAARISARITERIRDEKSRDDETRFIHLAFETVLSRSPRADEIAACREFLDRARTAAPIEDASRRAHENLVLVLFNHHEFVTIR